MRILRQFNNTAKEGFKGIWRNKGMGMASVISIAAVLVLFGLVLTLILNINNVVYQTSAKLDKVVVFLNDGISNEQVEELKAQISQAGNIKSIEFNSKDEALDKFKEQLKDYEYILEGLENNPLPASLTLSLNNIEEANEVVKKIKDLPGVETIKYYNEIIEKMVTLEKGVKYGGSIIIAILIFVAIVLIHNTIKIALNNRKREINIMKYIGATNNYIRRPFLIEGIFFGLLGSIFAILIVYYTYDLVYAKIDERLFEMVAVNLVNPKGTLVDMSIIFICMGAGIGYLGSLLSMKRFLDV